MTAQVKHTVLWLKTILLIQTLQFALKVLMFAHGMLIYAESSSFAKINSPTSTYLIQQHYPTRITTLLTF